MLLSSGRCSSCIFRYDLTCPIFYFFICLSHFLSLFLFRFFSFFLSLFVSSSLRLALFLSYSLLFALFSFSLLLPQNQALAQQSNRQQEALQHVMRVFTRLGISPEGDIPQHLSAFGSNSAWPMSGVGVGAQGSASAGQGFGSMGGNSMGGAGQGYAYNQQMSFGQQQQQGGMQGGMMSRDPKGDRELAILVDDESMDIDAVLASMEQNPRDGFVSVS